MCSIAVSTLVVEWIEIFDAAEYKACVESPPSWWSGLKYTLVERIGMGTQSPPSWWSGLKSAGQTDDILRRVVSTLVVEWIEIAKPDKVQSRVQGLHPRGGVD